MVGHALAMRARHVALVISRVLDGMRHAKLSSRAGSDRKGSRQ
jgi:hypothetical protein